MAPRPDEQIRWLPFWRQDNDEEDDDDNEDGIGWRNSNTETSPLVNVSNKTPTLGQQLAERQGRGRGLGWIIVLAMWVGIFVWRGKSHTFWRPSTDSPTLSPSSSPTPTPTLFMPTMAPTATPSCPRHFVNRKGAAVPTNYSRPDFAARLDENLVLCEGFDDKTASTRIWRADKSLFGEGNGGFAYYTPENVVQQDGALQIRPGLFPDLGMITTKGGLSYPAADVMVGNCTPFPACATLDLTHQNCTVSDFDGCERIGTPLVALNPVTSGRITTKGSFEMLYGRLEARIRLPQGDWLWPALWMMPVNESKYGGWPDSGEFDILESKGNDPNVFGSSGEGRNMFSSCLHYSGNSWWKTRNSLSATDIFQVCRNGTLPVDQCDWSTDYFTIGLYWSPTRMYTYVLRENDEEVKIWDVDATQGFGPNDSPLGSNYAPFSNEENTANKKPQGPYVDESPNKNAPFDQPFYLILNLSVGGEINGCPNPGYWGPDAIWCTKRDANNPQLASRTIFWNNKDLWYPSWQEAKEKGKDAFAVDWIKVWQ